MTLVDDFYKQMEPSIKAFLDDNIIIIDPLEAKRVYATLATSKRTHRLPHDISELLIARRGKIKVSDEVLADRIGIYTWKLKAFLKRRKLPNESDCKLIIDFLREVKG